MWLRETFKKWSLGEIILLVSLKKYTHFDEKNENTYNHIHWWVYAEDMKKQIQTVHVHAYWIFNQEIKNPMSNRVDCVKSINLII